MPLITMEYLAERLEPDVLKAKKSYKVTRQSFGPALYDKWLSLAQGEDGFLHRASTGIEAPRKKIIFSNALLSKSWPLDENDNNLESALISAMIEHFDVYLWPGETESFAECKPLRDSSEFWKNLHTIKAATSKKVKECLTAQGISGTNCIYLDRNAYNDFLFRCDFNGKDSLDQSNEIDLRNIPLSNRQNRELLKASFDEIKQVRMEKNPTQEDAENLLHYFPEMAKIIVTKPEKTENEKKFKQIFQSLASKVSFTRDKRPTQIVLNTPLFDPDLPDELRWNRRCLSRMEDQVLDLSAHAKSKAFSLFPMKNSQVKFAYPNQLEKLWLNDSTHCQIDLSLCTNLKKLILRNTIELKLKIPHSLEDLSISRNNQQPDLSVFQNLKTLEINSSTMKTLCNLPSTLQSLSLYKLGNLSSIDTSACQSLKYLSITDCDSLESLDLAKFSNLEELEIECCAILRNINFSGCPNLKRLKIKNSPITNLDFNLSKLEVLSIKLGNESEAPKSIYADFTNMKNLRHLTLHGVNANQLNLTPCSELESVQLLNAHFNVISCQNLHKLKKFESCKTSAVIMNFRHSGIIELEASFESNINTINLNTCNKLRSLYLDMIKPSNVTIKNLDQCNQLRSVNLGNINNASTYYNLLPNYCEITNETTKNIELITLHQFNENNNTSVFSLRKSLGIDGKTAVTPNKSLSAIGNLKYTVERQQGITMHHYRVEVADDIVYEKDKIIYTSKPSIYQEVKIDIPTFDYEKMKSLRLRTQQNGSLGIGILDGNLEPEEFYPLVTDHTFDPNQPFEIYSQPENAVKLFWNQDHQQYYVQLISKQPCKVKILYHFKQNPAYNNIPTGNPYAENRSLLPSSLNEEIKKYLESKVNPDLNFLISNADLATKLKLLISFCQKFENEALKNLPQTDLEIIKALMTESKGACRHRSQVFMLLARYLGIPVRMILNEKHAFCEIPFEEKNQLHYHGIDLGGAPSLDLTPATVRTNDFTPLPDLPKLAQEEKKEVKANKYISHFDQLLKERELSSTLSVIQNRPPLAPILELTAKQNPLDVNRAIVNQLHDAKQFSNYIYINRPEDFKQYFEPYTFQGGIRKKMPGPLANLIKEGGVLVVNWSNFTPKQIASYKSILDAKPTLFGKPLANNVNVISLKTPATNACSAFTSRCQPFYLDDKFLTVKEEKKSEVIVKPVPFDLFKRLDWREYLFGEIKFVGKKLMVSKGPLIKAIESNTPFTILNPPDDEDFRVLLRRIQDERQLLYFDKMVPVPPDFIITTEIKPHPSELKNVQVQYVNSAPLEKNWIYLSLQNIHECFAKLIIKDKQANAEGEGFLKTHTNFYITEDIPEPDWQQLLYFISEHFPEKFFQFHVAPGVEIENVQSKNKLPANVIPSDKSSLTFSNDPDFYALQLKNAQGDNTKIIDVSPQMGFHDLLAKLEIKTNDQNDNVEYNYHEKAILSELKKGTKIILNGELSPALYHQLLPMLSPHPHLFSNGEYIEFKPDQFHVVMPAAAKKNLPLFHFKEKNYKWNDYKIEFKEDALLNRIEQFYQYANHMPNLGTGRPEVPTFSRARIKRMINALKKPMHRANPIKGIFHYDYPKKSEEYAYLNTMAKVLFKMEAKADDRIYKLSKIKLKSSDDWRKQQWKILNCLSAKSLHQFFENKIDNYLDPHATFPSLTEAGLKKLEYIVASLLQTSEMKHDKKSHAAKREQQLQYYLEDEDTHLIFLKGPAGVGKSYTVRTLKDKLNFDYFEGTTGIEKWLTAAASDNPKVLLLDEANMSISGTWDFFKGLCRDGKVLYKGKEYQLSPQHKIISTGNPETYPERFYHLLFQDYAETLYFKMPEDTYIENEILKKILKPKGLMNLSKQLITAYNLIYECNPTYVYSFRDLENLALRTTLPPHDLLQACIIEFAGTVHDVERRQQFIEKLSRTLNLYENRNRTDILLQDIVIPKQYANLVEGIEQDLLLRQLSLESKGSFLHKQGILIEGEAGLGKSTLLENLLIKHQIKYDIISAGEKNAHDILLKAFHEGTVVILDELNLDESLEKLLNQLLTGQDPEGKPAINRGFMVLASQNPTHERGRVSLSQALRNRMHVYYMEPHTTESLQTIASYKIHEEAKEYVDAFVETRNKNPQVTTRLFLSGLKPLTQTLAADQARIS